jgi:serine protease Do
MLLMLPLLIAGMACGQTGESPAPHRERSVFIMNSGSPEAGGFLGVSTRDVRPAIAKEKNLGSKTGALVTEVVEDSPAEKAGIAENDVIVEFNGKSIDDASDLIKAVRKADPGSKATVVVYRGTQKKSLQATLSKAPESRTFTWTEPHGLVLPRMPHAPRVNVRVFAGAGAHGLHLMDLNPQLGEYFGAPEGKGVLVEKVSKRSAAKDAGFKAGDVILRVGKEDVEELDDVWEALEDYKAGDSSAVEILRKGSRLTLRLEIDETDDMDSYYFRRPAGTGDDDHLERMFEDQSQFEKQSRMMKQNKFNLQKDMQKLQEELRSMGKEIRSRMDMLRKTLNRELRQVVG